MEPYEGLALCVYLTGEGTRLIKCTAQSHSQHSLRCVHFQPNLTTWDKSRSRFRKTLVPAEWFQQSAGCFHFQNLYNLARSFIFSTTDRYIFMQLHVPKLIFDRLLSINYVYFRCETPEAIRYIMYLVIESLSVGKITLGVDMAPST